MSGQATFVPREPVYIGGIGARTPVGVTAESASAAVRVGLSAINEQPFFYAADGESMRAAADHFLAPDLPISERMTDLLLSALSQLAPLAATKDQRVLIAICVPEPRPGLPPSIGETLIKAVKTRFPLPGLLIQQVTSGHSSGLLGLGVAAKALEDDKADLAVVAGVDSYLDRGTMTWMDGAGTLKSEMNRDGFFPGEAAGALLIGRRAAMAALGITPLARLTAVSIASEPIPIDDRGPVVCTGEGLSEAILGLRPVVEADGRLITDVYCDLNGQRYRTDEWLYALTRSQGLFVNVLDNWHPADCWGDVGAASGPLFATLAHFAFRKSYANGTRAVFWTSSIGGRRAAVLLDFPEAEKRNGQ